MSAEYKRNNIKALMQMHDLTIEGLAQELNLSVSTINRLLMSSTIDPKLSTLRPIAKFFGISIDELVGDKPLNLKPSDFGNDFNNKIMVQVPVIHWEQVKETTEIIPRLNFHNWENWTVIYHEVSELAYALKVKQSSLPPPFYFQTIIVVDPGKEPQDSDFVIVLHNNNPIVCNLIFNGINKLYKSLLIGKIFEEAEIEFNGTVVQWTIPYYEKASI